MPTLYPPDYPLRPDAPLMAFGPAFAEVIARFLLRAVLPPDLEDEHERALLAAAALTMLEGFHPRDHLECMIAAQGVAAFTTLMDCHRRVNHADIADATGIKLRGNIAQIGRAFSIAHHDLERRHAKPLAPRPPEAVSPPVVIPPPPSEPEPVVETIRPDGTPASLSDYAPEPAPPPFVPGEPLIMRALATRPKLWRMVNTPKGEEGTATPAPVLPLSPVSEPPAVPPRSGVGLLDLRERIFTGDSLARFASARFDPDAPRSLPPVEEDATVELRRVPTGADPDEAEEPPIIIRYGPDTRRPKED